MSIVLQLRGSGKPVRVVLADESRPPIGDLVAKALTDTPQGAPARFVVEPLDGPPADLAALDARVAREEIDGYLVLPADVVTSGRASYVGTDASSQIDMGRLTSRFETAVIKARALALGLKADDTPRAPRPRGPRRATGQRQERVGRRRVRARLRRGHPSR